MPGSHKISVSRRRREFNVSTMETTCIERAHDM